MSAPSSEPDEDYYHRAPQFSPVSWQDNDNQNPLYPLPRAPSPPPPNDPHRAPMLSWQTGPPPTHPSRSPSPYSEKSYEDTTVSNRTTVIEVRLTPGSRAYLSGPQGAVEFIADEPGDRRRSIGTDVGRFHREDWSPQPDRSVRSSRDDRILAGVRRISGPTAANAIMVDHEQRASGYHHSQPPTHPRPPSFHTSHTSQNDLPIRQRNAPHGQMPQGFVQPSQSRNGSSPSIQRPPTLQSPRRHSSQTSSHPSYVPQTHTGLPGTRQSTHPTTHLGSRQGSHHPLVPEQEYTWSSPASQQSQSYRPVPHSYRPSLPSNSGHSSSGPYRNNERSHNHHHQGRGNGYRRDL